MKEIINTKNAPAAIGPYVQAVKTGALIHVSGQIALRLDGTMIEADISKQSVQIFENLKAVLEAAGTSMENVVKVNCYITDINNFAAFNEIYASYFQTNFPARSCVEVSRLPKDSMVEIDAIALCS